MQNFSNDGKPEFPLPANPTLVHFHDETIFYAHDHKRRTWYHKDVPAKSYAKGEGLSLMVADYVPADFGWLTSRDGTRNARRIIKPGKKRDGYFTSEAQANDAMHLLLEEYPEYNHVLDYDNATKHLKDPEGSLSA